MSDELQSYDKFNYSLRPAKQVERKLIVECLHRLSQCGIFVGNYTYLGFGAPYYADFLLFHKSLHIDSMICVEGSGIPNRMEFNKPYDFITVENMEFSKYVADMVRDRKYLVWLDYDKPLDEDKIQDVNNCIGRLGSASLLLVTVDAKVRLPDNPEDRELSQAQREIKLAELLNETMRNDFGQDITVDDVSETTLPKLYSKVLFENIKRKVEDQNKHFHLLFNFLYADNAPMLTIGGLIMDQDVSACLFDNGIYSLPYIRSTINDDPQWIKVPPLTLREKLYLDKHKGGQLPFELDSEIVDAFQEFCRYYPSYHEVSI